ncbi:MAG: hypothetical protein HY698_04440 [Deltaproteobacteria bacterium]|nr:hypothetical protein [Deltaproteobacteria bacterium]
MNILYGVVGEGMGHATRSKVIISHLLSSGHHVKVLVSGRAHAYLKRFFPDVEEITGLRLIYEENAVKRGRSFRNFLKELPLWGGWAENFDIMTRVHENFRADCVISDFESLAYLYGQRYEVPVISIDNIQVINRCAIEVDIPAEERVNFSLARGAVKAKLPGCHHYLITTFYYPPVRKERTTLYPPILRGEILAAKARTTIGEHVLVYQTSDSFAELVPTLRKMHEHFVVYGLGRDEELGNVTLKSFSELGFIDDLASARAVIAGGGFSLISESIYLGKPILSVPVKKQFEQLLNALYVEHLGYGACARDLAADDIRGFLERVPDHAARVATHVQDGNREIFAAIDRLLRELAS